MSQALARHLIPWLQLDWPLDWSALFSRAAPLVLEIGFGNGAFLLNLAERNAGFNHVGIERSWGSIQRLARGAQRRGLDNVRMLEGDAPWLLAHAFAPESLQEVHINFPDPWHKQRHQSRRLIRPDFIHLLSGRLATAGRLCVATDVAEYAQWIAHVLEGQSALRSQFSASMVHELAGRIRTKYERKALEQGRSIHYFVWHKAQATATDPIQAQKVEPMPNIRMTGAVPLATVLQGLCPRCWRQVHRGVDVVIKLESAFQGLNPHEGLLCVWVKEGALTQSLALLVLVQGGEALLKPASIGYPRPTFGVKQALRLIAQAMLERHPQLRVVSSTVGAPGAQESADE